MRYKLTTFLILINAIFLIAGTSTHFNSSSPPASKTDAPGESTCAASNCHVGSREINVGNGEVNISVNSLDSLYYFTDSTYTLTVTVNSSDQNTFGFEVTALNKDDNMAGSFDTIESNTTPLSGNNREYVGHSGVSGDNEWQLKWNSPSSNVGEVTFYVAGNAADGDGSGLNDGGDSIYTNTLTLAPHPDDTSDTVSFTPDVATASIGVYPNPVRQKLNIDYNFSASQQVQVRLLNVNGEGVHRQTRYARQSSGHWSIQIPNHLSGGIYFLQLCPTKGKVFQEKVVIK